MLGRKMGKWVLWRQIQMLADACGHGSVCTYVHACTKDVHVHVHVEVESEHPFSHL